MDFGLRLAAVLSLTLYTGLIQSGHSSELAANCTLTSQTHDEDHTVVELTVHLLNGSDSAIHNVDLRIDQRELQTSANGVHQLGSIDAGEAAVAQGETLLSNDRLDQIQNILLRVDYEDEAGATHSVTINAGPVNRP